MGKVYFYPKKNFLKEKFCEMEVHFKNGDYVTIKKNEYLGNNIRFCDDLVMRKHGMCFIGHDGRVKTKVNFSKRANCNYCHVYNAKEFMADRKKYIEERCQKQGEIEFIRLSNDLNWSFDIYGNITAKKEEDFLFFEFDTEGRFQEENATINLAGVSKSDVRILDLDFENCENISVFRDEIVDMNLDFDEGLDWSGDALVRKVRGGFIKIKFDKNFGPRNAELFENFYPKIKHFEYRLCGRKNFCEHDICNLYIDYEHLGAWGKEHFWIEDIRDFDDLPDEEDYDEYDFDPAIPYHVGGYAERQKDGTILIAFGKACQKRIDDVLEKRNKLKITF